MQNVTLANSETTPIATRQPARLAERPLRPWLQDGWLWILLVGPLVAPLFAALGWPVLRPIADGIYLLGQMICPKVSEHLIVFGQPMAVCLSCWGAVWGLWMVRLLYGRAGEGFGPFSRLGLAPLWARWSEARPTDKLGVLAVGFMPWALDVMLWDTGAWRSPLLFMAFVGFLGGLAAGALLLPTAAAMRERVLSRERAERLARLRARSSWSR